MNDRAANRATDIAADSERLIRGEQDHDAEIVARHGLSFYMDAYFPGGTMVVREIIKALT